MNKKNTRTGGDQIAAELLKRIFLDDYEPDRRFDKAIAKSIRHRKIGIK